MAYKIPPPPSAERGAENEQYHAPLPLYIANQIETKTDQSVELRPWSHYAAHQC